MRRDFTLAYGSKTDEDRTLLRSVATRPQIWSKPAASNTMDAQDGYCMQRLGSLPFLSGTDMALPFARSKLCLWFPSNALAYARARAAATRYHSDTRSLGLGRTKMRLSRVEFLNIRRKEAALGGQSSAR